MSFYANITGTWKKVTLWQNIAGVWKKITLWQNVNGTWKKISGATSGGGGALAASADPSYVFGSVSRQASTRVFTNAVTVAASGGSGNYAYAWGIQAGWTIESPTSASTRFSAIASAGDDKTATFVCTVTDGAGATTTVSVTAEVANYYTGGKNVSQV